MQRPIRDQLFFLALCLFTLATCYWAGTRYGFAAGGAGGNCVNCACKNVTAWQVAADNANEGHGFQQQIPKSNPPRYAAVLTAQLNISTLQNSCTNGTGNTNQVNGQFANWFYVNAAPVCAKGVLPQEVSVSDVGVLKAAAGGVLVCQ